MIMRSMDWPRVFSLLAHELRSPAGVIAGYARMLSEGRLSSEDQLQAFAQIERAAGRITTISRQASDLSRWLGPEMDGAAPVAIADLMTRAVAQTTTPARVTIDATANANGLHLPAIDRAALTAAIAAAVDAVCREVTEGVVISPRVDAADAACDILIGSATALAALPERPSRDPSVTQWSADHSGMGLALVLGAVVVLAHGGQLCSFGVRRDVLAIRLRTHTEGV